MENRRVLNASGLVWADDLTAGGVDNYDYIAQAGEVVTLSLSGEDGLFVPRAAIFSPEGSRIGSIVDSGEKHVFSLQDGGSYRVIIENGGTAGGTYAVALEGLKPRSLDSIEVQLGETHQGSIDAAFGDLGAEIDEYHFDVATAGSILTLALADTASGSFSPRMELYDPTGTRVGLTTLNGNSTSAVSSGDKVLTDVLTETGTYVLQVHDNDFTHTGDYGISVESLVPASPDAVPMALGDVQVSRIEELGDVDEYTFTVSAADLAAAGGEVVITASLSELVPGTTSELWAELFSPSGQQVETIGIDEVENGHQVLYRLEQPGTYVFQVFDHDYADAEDYGFALEGLRPASADSIAIGVGVPVQGTIDPVGEVDAFRFTLTTADLVDAGGTYSLQMALASERTTDYRLQATLYSPTGVPVGSPLGAGSARIVSLTAAGEYVIQVHDDDFTETAAELIARGKSPEYTLSLSDVQAPQVATVEVSDVLVSDADVGLPFSVTVVFSETMATNVTPSLSFVPYPVADGVTPSFVSAGAGVWGTTHVTNDTWTRTFDVLDRGIDVPDVRIDVLGAKDLAGNPQQDYLPEVEFAIDTAEPVIASLSPANDATNVDPETDLQILFNQPISVASGEITIRRVTDDVAVQTITIPSDQVTAAGTAATIRPPASLDRDVEVYVEISSGAFVDLVGNASAGIQGSAMWSFTAEPLFPNAPVVVAPIPDLTELIGATEAQVELAGVFDDLDLTAGDTLTISYDDAADNTNRSLVTGTLVGQTLTLNFAEGTLGQAILTVRATDSTGRTTADSFRVQVVSAPVAVDDDRSTDEDTLVAIDVTTNDISDGGFIRPTTVQLVPGSGPQSGILTQQNGVFFYLPDPNFSGSDRFRYRVRDSHEFESNEATVTITIREVPDYQNPVQNRDIDNSGGISPVDVLVAINYVNAFGYALPPDPIPPAQPTVYYDVDGDNAITPVDILDIINYLNAQNTYANGESPIAADLPPLSGIAAAPRPASLVDAGAEGSLPLATGRDLDSLERPRVPRDGDDAPAVADRPFSVSAPDSQAADRFFDAMAGPAELSPWGLLEDLLTPIV